MKTHRPTTALLSLLLVAVLAGGCFKKIGYDTFYVLQPWTQDGAERFAPPFGTVRAYAFAADTTYWAVRSYEEALAGTIASVRTGERMEALAEGEPYVIDGNENWLAMQLDGPRFFILAVDLEHRLYAYTEQAMGENLPRLHASVVFPLVWKSKRVKNGKWVVCNDFYEPEVPVTPPDAAEDSAPQEQRDL